jgi:ABC-type branched-subunit amino acid transport system ATPase component
MSLLSVHNLSLTLGGQQILRDISFSVKQGEIVGLIGPNGSGKTTLFNVLSGFFRPTTGCILFREEDLTELSPSQRAQRGLGRVFQNFGIFRDMTLEENVLVALEALPREQRRALGSLHERVELTLSLLGLREKGKEKASSLSGGQMRLLEIGRTLASGKELFLLDEPTAGVSPKMTKQVSDLIREVKHEGRTVLIIEHDLPFISTICDRVLVLDVGEVVLEGTPQEVHHHQKLQEIYFGADPTG